jgi:galactokinase
LTEIVQPHIAEQTFTAVFGGEPVASAWAFGRVNLIGEHTDYNGGFVLPALIPQSAVATVAPTGGDRVRVWSRELSLGHAFEAYRLGAERSRHTWVDYVQGVTVALRAAGHVVPGFDLALASDVPLGSGLSSSAALEVSVLRALRQLFSLRIDDVEIARLGRAAETDFVGAPIGIMDQMASSLGRPGVALFIDTRTLVTEAVSLPDGSALIVINSGVAHQHAQGDYRTRRAECERAAALLGVPELREVTVDQLDHVAALPSPLDRRARHVVTENDRVLDAVEAMRVGDVVRLGVLFTDSHISQRDDYECSVPEVDELVEIALREPSVFGARLTGGGFGGSIVALAREAEAAAAAAHIAAEYERRTDRRATVLVPA